jgi:hypothetical protein
MNPKHLTAAVLLGPSTTCAAQPFSTQANAVHAFGTYDYAWCFELAETGVLDMQCNGDLNCFPRAIVAEDNSFIVTMYTAFDIGGGTAGFRVGHDVRHLSPGQYTVVRNSSKTLLPGLFIKQ